MNRTTRPLFAALAMVLLLPHSELLAVEIATLNSTDSIIGQQETGGPGLGYQPSGGSTVGTGGSGGSRTDRNVVLGFTLPTLPSIEVVSSADLSFEITQGRNSPNDPNTLPVLHAYLLDTTNPDITGTDFFYHGMSDPASNVAFIDSTSVPISGANNNSFADDSQDRTFTLTGDALSLFKSFYGGDNVPDQAEAFFRFNLAVDPDEGDLIRYNIDFDFDESSVSIGTATVPEPASITIWSLFCLGLVGYRRRRGI